MDTSTAEASSPHLPVSTPVDRIPREHLRVIGLLLVSAFVVILNETTMGVALPPIMDDLGVTAATGQWLTTVFMLTMAVVIPSTGFLLQRLGTRGSFMLAMSLFTAGTAVAAFAPGFGVLVTARVVQASGTAIMMPLLMTTVMTLVPPHLRGRVMGNVSLVIAAAPALGPTMSGALVGPLGWRGVFAVVLPIAAVTLVVGGLLVRDVAVRSDKPLDVLSLLLAAVAFGGLVYGLSSLGEMVRGEVPVHPAAPLALGVVALAVFVWRQLRLQRVDDALLDLRVFAAGSFSTSLGAMAVSMLAMFGALILLPLLLQDALGLTPLQSGLLLLPGGLAMGLLGPVVGNLYDRLGPRPLVVPGTIAVVVALAGMSTVTPGMSPFFFLAAHVLMSLGLALTFTPLFTTALGSLRPHLYSHGSAAIGTVQQLAGAAGTAMFIAIFTARSFGLADGGASEAVAVAGGARVAFAVGAAVMLAATGLAFMVRKPESPEGTGGPAFH